jgi:protein-tyrosine phosphatase
MKRVLFLCSANYYRSRFAEILFDHLAQENKLEWSADSRGIIAELCSNPGVIAQATLNELAKRSILHQAPRSPLQLTENDFAQAERIIALYEPEHRPMVREYFSEWEPKIEFWSVPDLDELDSEQALALIEANVQRLINSLRKLPDSERK